MRPYTEEKIVEIRDQDRVVWVGDDTERPIGSSGKAGTVTPDQVEVNWGAGDVGVSKHGEEIVSCLEAGRRGIDPWTRVYEDAIAYGMDEEEDE